MEGRNREEHPASIASQLEERISCAVDKFTAFVESLKDLQQLIQLPAVERNTEKLLSDLQQQLVYYSRHIETQRQPSPTFSSQISSICGGEIQFHLSPKLRIPVPVLAAPTRTPRIPYSSGWTFSEDHEIYQFGQVGLKTILLVGLLMRIEVMIVVNNFGQIEACSYLHTKCAEPGVLLCLESEVILFGGLVAGEKINSTQRFRTDTSIWKPGKSMIYARSSFTPFLLPASSYVYLVGGCCKKIERFCLSSNEFEELQHDLPCESLTIAIAPHSEAIIVVTRNDYLELRIRGKSCDEICHKKHKKWALNCDSPPCYYQDNIYFLRGGQIIRVDCKYKILAHSYDN